MKALVGRFAPGAEIFQARWVDLEGQPSWTLAQLWLIWDRECSRDNERLMAHLLFRDWSLLADSVWPADAEDNRKWAYVSGVGRGLPLSFRHRAKWMRMPDDRPTEDGIWAYLWENTLDVLHVYASHGGGWHHLATLPADVWRGMTERMVLDIQSRYDWLEGGDR